MDFTLSQEQTLLRATARALFAKECPLALVRSAWDERAPGRALFERHLAGWTELAEGDLVDAALFVEEHGRAAAPGPFFATLLAAIVARAGGLSLAGAATVAVAGPDGEWTPHEAPTKHYVLSLDDAGELLVVSGSSAAPRLARVPCREVEVHEVEQMDRLRPLFRCDTAGSAAARQTVAIAPEAYRDAVERALVLVSAELIGVGRWLVEGAVAYAKQREQFGRPIGSFQGLQWQLVDASLALERAAAAVAYAAMCVDADDRDRHRAVHGAKAEAGRAARQAARTGMQVHGGIGYTFEHGLHFWLRRAFAGDAYMGPSTVHHDRLAALLFDASR